jgi:hypothetical protein
MAALGDVLRGTLPFLDVRSSAALRGASRGVRDDVRACDRAAAAELAFGAVVRDGALRGLADVGGGLRRLTLRQTRLATADALCALLARAPNVRALALHDVHWDEPPASGDAAVAGAVAGLRHLSALRLQYDRPRDSTVAALCAALPRMASLRRLTLFARLGDDDGARPALVRALGALVKLKLSPAALDARDHGASLLDALAPGARLTLQRPNGGPPLRREQCEAVARCVGRLSRLHVRDCGLWRETLVALTPATDCPALRGLKLVAEYLDDPYCAAAGRSGPTSAALAALVARVPNLETLRLDNCHLHAGAAAALPVARLRRLRVLGLDSNPMGDAALLALVRALPPTVTQLLLAGVGLTDAGAAGFAAALRDLPRLWALGLNGNAVGDAGAQLLAPALRGLPELRDVGVTLSDMTDDGAAALAAALRDAPALRAVFLYTQPGFKTASRVTGAGLRALRLALPRATLYAGFQFTRHFKTPD